MRGAYTREARDVIRGVERREARGVILKRE
jgi:hypothetical protein